MILLGALIIGLSLGLFGSGGSILTVPVLLYLAGDSPKQAIAGALLVVAVISIVASVRNGLKKQISWKHVLWLSCSGVVGTSFGAWLASFVSGAIQLLVFAALMLVSVRLMWKKPVYPTAMQQTPGANIPIMLLQGCAIGVVTGFVGVGGGFLLVPALIYIGRLPFAKATGSSLAIIVVNSLVGFLHYLPMLQAEHQSLDWPNLFILISFGIGGSLVGQYLIQFVNRDKLQRAFALFLILMAVFVTYQTLPKLLA